MGTTDKRRERVLGFQGMVPEVERSVEGRKRVMRKKNAGKKIQYVMLFNPVL